MQFHEQDGQIMYFIALDYLGVAVNHLYQPHQTTTYDSILKVEI